MSSNRVHQLSGGLYVSGAPPEQSKERGAGAMPTMTSTVMPYTGGDVKKSGELGKMFDINVEQQLHRVRKSGQLSNAGGAAMTTSTPLVARGGGGGSGSFRNANNVHSNPNSGPLTPPPPPQITHLGSFGRPTSNSGPPTSNSGPLCKSGDSRAKSSAPPSRQNSGPLTPSLPATGLITSGPFSSGSASRNHSGSMESNSFSRTSSMQGHKNPVNQAITHLSHDNNRPSLLGGLPRVIFWTVVPLFIIGFIAGGFILGAVQNPVLLIIVVSLFAAVILLLTWSYCLGQRAASRFVAKHPSVGLDEAKDGQYVKISGIVTCGSVPLETSYQRVSRCVYTSCALYEYRSMKSKPANSNHKIFSWGLRHLERRVADFYISDRKSGLRALVKVGYGASVTPFVEDSTIVDVTKKDREPSSNFLQWLADHNLSSDDRIMRLKEGYIKEGSMITVMGVIRRTENVLMIVPPSDPLSTGCQWRRLFLPATLSGIILMCEEDSSKDDVIPV